MKKKINTQPYKGTRDYYPEDMFKRNYLFDTWSETAKEFGYEEYDTPLIEEADLYRAKSGDELANTQLYNFTDKGGREVAIRPEMTPSLARIIAAKGAQIPKPIRWFNIGKYYRYEKPQRGRSREFFQLNIDIFGIETAEAEVEIFQFIDAVMKKLKAPNDSWALYVNNRYLLDYLFTKILNIEGELVRKVARAIDNFTKMEAPEFKNYLKDLSLNDFQIAKVMEFLSMDIKGLEALKGKSKGADQLIKLFDLAEKAGLKNVQFKPYIMRGIDYYTGTVIELFDVGGDKNPRALFGGGRYDDLLEIFGKERLPAFGLGWGSVTTMDFMETYGLFPKYEPTAKVFVTLPDGVDLVECTRLTSKLRAEGIPVEQQLTPMDLRKQLTYASKKGFKWVLIVEDKRYTLKNLETGEQGDSDLSDTINKLTR